MGPVGNKKERVPAGAHSQKPLLIERMRSYEKSTELHIGEIVEKSKPVSWLTTYETRGRRRIL